MSLIGKYGKETGLRQMVGTSVNKKGKSKLRARDRDSHYDELKKTHDTEKEIEKVALLWAEGFKELFPLQEKCFFNIREGLQRLIKKVRQFESEKINFMDLKVEEIRPALLKTAVLNFAVNLKLSVNEYPEYFEPVEERILVEELISLDKVFEYIKKMENKGSLSEIFGKTDSQISKWKKYKNMSLKSLLEIKENMVDEKREEYKIDKRKINTYVLLMYVTLVIKGDSEEEMENPDDIDWENLIKCVTPLILYFSEEIVNFFAEQNKKNKNINNNKERR